ncbi:MAG TPA: hypothetical protein DCM49_00525 [Lachnospiraceae bacterium]|nr:hypothetical protein [Lachnospiraceae bacterium]
MAEETMSMEAIDESFKTFKDEGQANWETINQCLEEKTVLTVTVEEVVNKGVVTHVEGIRGFIPASHLSLSHVDDLNDYLQKEIEVQVLEADEEKNRLLLSARNVLRAKANEERQAKINAIAKDTILEGKVESIKPYGAFIDLGDRISGLVHISQISQKRINDPSDVLAVGDDVKVKVLDVKDGKISLSIKALTAPAAKAPREDRQEAAPSDYKLPKTEDLTTNLGSLLKNIKL